MKNPETNSQGQASIDSLPVKFFIWDSLTLTHCMDFYDSVEGENKMEIKEAFLLGHLLFLT